MCFTIYLILFLYCLTQAIILRVETNNICPPCQAPIFQGEAIRNLTCGHKMHEECMKRLCDVKNYTLSNSKCPNCCKIVDSAPGAWRSEEGTPVGVPEEAEAAGSLRQRLGPLTEDRPFDPSGECIRKELSISASVTRS